MNDKELNELIKIRDNAPEGATHVETGGNSNVLYWKLSESAFSTFEYWLNDVWVTTIDLAINLSSLSDINTIIQLEQQKRELINFLEGLQLDVSCDIERGELIAKVSGYNFDGWGLTNEDN